MGHQHLGKLPRTRRWQQVVELIGGGADVRAVAAKTVSAAERQMSDASNDAAVQHAVWLLTQIPAAARTDNFAKELRRLGLRVGDAPSLFDIATAMMEAIDLQVLKTGARTDLGEMAQLSAVESLNAIGGRSLDDLLGVTPEGVRTALRGLSSARQFAVLARDFFSRLAGRQLSYFLSRVLSEHVGVNSRFRTMREHREFEEALDLHCREASRVLKEYAGEWYSKNTYEGGIDQEKAGRFAHVAFRKLREELQQRGFNHA